MDPTLQQEDSLVACLRVIARFGGRPTSPEAVTRGLPLVGGKLAASDLAEAARNAGLSAEPIEDFKPQALTPFILPVVATRRDGAHVVLLRMRKDQICVIDPAQSADKERWVGASQLANELNGAAWQVLPVEFFDGRTLDGAQDATRDWFWSIVRLNVPVYMTAVVTSLFVNLTGALSVFYVMAIYDRVIPNRAMDTLAVITTGVVLLYAADATFKFLRARLIDTAARRFDMLAGSRIFAAVLGLPPNARPASVGTLSATIREFESLREFFASATLTVLADLPFMLVLVLVMFWVAGDVAFAPLIALPVMLLVGGGTAFASRKLSAAGHRESMLRQAMLSEFSAGLDTLQAHGGEAWARRRWERLVAQTSSTSERAREVGHVGLNLIGLTQSLTSVAVIAGAAVLVSQGKLSTGALAACSLLSGRVLAPLAALAGILQRYQQARQAYDALDKLLKGAGQLEAPGTRVHMPRIRGAIACRDVHFSYPAVGELPASEVLRGASFDIAEGEHVAILGRVGSGKTTLLNLLVGLSNATEGNALVDGVDTRLVAKPDLHAQIGYAPQFPMLFNGSIRENITLGHPGASDDEVREALRIAGLDDILASSAEGLAMPVGEGGRRLSGGTRQAVALARAVLMNPPILLLDEPTSMIDTAAERAIIERIAEARRGKTLVLVTHRPALLALVGRIIVLEQGRVVADGPRDSVLSQLRSTP